MLQYYSKLGRLYPPEYINKPIINLNESLLSVTDVLEIRISDGLERGAKYTNK